MDTSVLDFVNSIVPQEAIYDRSLEEPEKVPTQVIEPNRQTLPKKPLLPLKRKLIYFEESKGVSAFRALNKDVDVVNPTALPPPKWRLVEVEYLMEVTTSPSVSSQKDSDLTNTNQQNLGSSSQQVDPIEIRLSARASEPESEPRLSDLQFLQHLNTDIRKALFGAPVIQEDIDATIIICPHIKE